MENKNLKQEPRRILGLSPEASKNLEKGIEQTASALMKQAADAKNFSMLYLQFIRVLMFPFDLVWRLFAFVAQGMTEKKQVNPMDAKVPFELSDLLPKPAKENVVLAFFGADVSPVLRKLFNRRSKVDQAIEMANYDRNVVVHALDDITPYPELSPEEQQEMDYRVRKEDLNIG